MKQWNCQRSFWKILTCQFAKVTLYFWNFIDGIINDGIFIGEMAYRMDIVEDYVTSVEGTCGKEKTVIVTFKYAKREEVIAKILKKAKLNNSLSGVIFELVFRGYSFRLFSTGKVIFSDVPNKEELHSILSELLQ